MKITISLKPIFFRGAPEHFLTTNICEKRKFEQRNTGIIIAPSTLSTAPCDGCKWRGTFLKCERKEEAEE